MLILWSQYNPMRKEHFHLYSICSLGPGNRGDTGVVTDRLANYIRNHQHLVFPHKHDFYHLVFFTKGSGSHSIDFTQHTVKPGSLYAMAPGQVHTWDFGVGTDGYIVNFSAAYLSGLMADNQYAARFSFFAGSWQQQVITVNKEAQKQLLSLFEELIAETSTEAAFTEDRRRLLLAEILIGIQRCVTPGPATVPSSYNSLLLANFRNLVEQQFRKHKLTKEYAVQLYVTPNHLNALCKDMTGNSAGELIRERVILEAKRLLINAGLEVAEIAGELGFADDSYFIKFFRKSVGTTPAAFRKSYLQKRS